MKSRKEVIVTKLANTRERGIHVFLDLNKSK